MRMIDPDDVRRRTLWELVKGYGFDENLREHYWYANWDELHTDTIIEIIEDNQSVPPDVMDKILKI